MPGILFVCTANRIRSPLAEHLLLRRLASHPEIGTWRVESAGVWAADGLPAAAAARHIAAQFGFSLDQHRSRRVEAVDLSRFDRILTMERTHRNTLRNEFPALAAHVFMLSEVALGAEQNIPDPPAYADAVLLTAHRIDGLIVQALPALVAALAPHGRQFALGDVPGAAGTTRGGSWVRRPWRLRFGGLLRRTPGDLAPAAEGEESASA